MIERVVALLALGFALWLMATSPKDGEPMVHAGSTSTPIVFNGGKP